MTKPTKKAKARTKARKPSAKKEPVNAAVAYGCELCPRETPSKENGWHSYPGVEVDSPREMAAHLREKHGVEVLNVATEKKTMHISMSDHYRSYSEWVMPDGRRVATKGSIIPKEPGWP